MTAAEEPEAAPEDEDNAMIVRPTTILDPEGHHTFKDMSVLDLKRDARRELHYYFWLKGKTYAAIKAITGFDRWTIWEDIKYVRANWDIQSRDMDKIRDEALLRLHLDRVHILVKADDADEKIAWRYFNIVANIDMKILERYTQASQNTGDPELEKKMKILIDFMIEKMGPEAMTAFEEFYKTALAVAEVGEHIN